MQVPGFFEGSASVRSEFLCLSGRELRTSLFYGFDVGFFEGVHGDNGKIGVSG